MKKRLVYGIAVFLLGLSVAIVVWLGSFNPGPVKPASPSQTLIFWAGFSMIFLLMVALMWYLFREGAKLYLDRQSHKTMAMLSWLPNRLVWLWVLVTSSAVMPGGGG